MGRISRRHLHKDVEERIYEVFWEHLANLPTRVLVREFLESLLSVTEQVMLAKRLAIAILLSRGHTYAYIDEALKVSKATIASIDRELSQRAPGYLRAIEASNRRRAKEKFWDSLEEVLIKITPPQAVGSAGHALKSAAGKSLYKRRLKRSVL